MWVVLVIHLLNREYDKGRVHLLRSRLNEIPGTLNELFKDIVTRDTEDPEDLLFCIQLVLFAIGPLELEEIYFAIMSSLSRSQYEAIDIDDISSEDMERFIVNASKGLVEVTRSQAVQFIHETVRDFLFGMPPATSLWPKISGNFEGHCHERIKLACLATIELALTPDHTTLSIKTALDAKASIPFLYYAVANIFYHAAKAHIAGIIQTAFLVSFPMVHWTSFMGLFQSDISEELRRKELPNNAACFYRESIAALDRLLGLCPRGIEMLDCPASFNGRTPLSTAARYGILPLVEFLCDKGADVNHQDSGKDTALSHAVHEWHVPVVLLLLSRGADPSLGAGHRLLEVIFAKRDSQVKEPADVRDVFLCFLQHGAALDFKLDVLHLESMATTATNLAEEIERDAGLKVEW
ncbi:hypothetical protein B0H67DRAFT_580227 [Lasiosphaeris hirsuta]|uniref:Ankyrin repeat protein n=1 Tax=Lasiosphaeris hirsuta TaxID=260670 RepID=A0AA40AGD1_9PEZI|nr:hypothetical protein B0H67DRAFT_580227 [Lasiosphaeris hirsuta]